MNKKFHLHIVQQIMDSLNSISDSCYTKKLDVLSNNSLGQHYRHVLEFYVCLFEGIKNGRVNYDNRKRDYIIETQRSYALQVTKDIYYDIAEVDESQNLELETTIGSHASHIPTNVAREMIYLSEHTIHHFALVKIGIDTSFPEIEVEENFGVAPSTVAYNEQK